MLALFCRTSFLTTFYFLYFSHNYTYHKLQSFSHVGPLWAAFLDFLEMYLPVLVLPVFIVSYGIAKCIWVAHSSIKLVFFMVLESKYFTDLKNQKKLNRKLKQCILLIPFSHLWGGKQMNEMLILLVLSGWPLNQLV